jgi:hypothetical protein
MNVVIPEKFEVLVMNGRNGPLEPGAARRDGFHRYLPVSPHIWRAMNDGNDFLAWLGLHHGCEVQPLRDAEDANVVYGLRKPRADA